MFLISPLNKKEDKRLDELQTLLSLSNISNHRPLEYKRCAKKERRSEHNVEPLRVKRDREEEKGSRNVRMLTAQRRKRRTDPEQTNN